MAKRFDPEFVERVGVYYETHEHTAAEVAEHFGLSPKTVESWISRKGWVKGRYRGKAEELKKEINQAKAAAIVGMMAEDGAINKAIDVMEGDLKRASYMLDNIAIEQISASVLDNQMRYAVQKAQAFAATAKNIGTIKTYAEIVKMAKETIHGKAPETVVNLQLGDITPAEIASMSDAQIRALLQQAQEGIIDAEVKGGDKRE